MPPSVKKSWHRQEGESDRRYEVFCHYLRTAPSKRSQLHTYQQMYNKPSAVQAGGDMAKWSSQHDWVERAGDYDSEQREKRIENGAQIVQDVCTTAVEKAPRALEILLDMMEEGTKDDRVRLDAAKYVLALAGVEALKKPDVAINSNGGGLHVYLPDNQRKKTND